MVNPISSVLTEQDEDIREVTPANAVLLRRLGLEALPAHETLILPTARLIVVWRRPPGAFRQTPGEKYPARGHPAKPLGGRAGRRRYARCRGHL